MRLTKQNICHYLLDKGFISFKSVVDGDFSVIQHQGRNLVFKILRTQNPCLFVKQLVDMLPQNIYLLQKEATCYWMFFNDPIFASVKEFIPNYSGYDAQSQALVVEFIPWAENIHDILLKEVQQPKEYAHQMGKILARLHINITEKVKHNSSLQFFSQQVPWAFNFPGMNPAQSFPAQSQQQVLHLIQQNQELCAAVSKAKEEWKISCLIHGDVKLVNFIATPSSEPAPSPVVKLIDWEIADIGDPCWDIAGGFQAFLAPWVLSFDNTNPHNPVFLASMKVFTITETRSSIREFWKAYVKEKKLAPPEAAKILLKSVKYSAVRLLQTAVESAMMTTQLMPHSVRLIQTAYNILQNPQKAMEKLFELQV